MSVLSSVFNCTIRANGQLRGYCHDTNPLPHSQWRILSNAVAKRNKRFDMFYELLAGQSGTVCAQCISRKHKRNDTLTNGTGKKSQT